MELSFKSFFVERPPLVMFLIGLLITSVSLLSISHHVKTVAIKDPNHPINWNGIFEQLSDKSFSNLDGNYSAGWIRNDSLNSSSFLAHAHLVTSASFKFRPHTLFQSKVEVKPKPKSEATLVVMMREESRKKINCDGERCFYQLAVCLTVSGHPHDLPHHSYEHECTHRNYTSKQQVGLELKVLGEKEGKHQPAVNFTLSRIKSDKFDVLLPLSERLRVSRRTAVMSILFFIASITFAIIFTLHQSSSSSQSQSSTKEDRNPLITSSTS